MEGSNIMGSGIIGKIIYFWIFIIGGLFFARVFGFASDDKTLVIILIAIAIVYIVFQVFRTLGQRKREYEAEAVPAAPVRKGNSKKRKKR